MVVELLLVFFFTKTKGSWFTNMKEALVNVDGTIACDYYSYL
jgi:hypothetical protein